VAYTLRPGQAAAGDIRRILDAQLRLAIASLRDVHGPDDAGRVGEARRHVKKARAVARLVRPVTPRSHRAVERRLRRVSRMLGPIADGEALVGAFAVLRPALRALVPPREIAAMRSNLAEREAWVDHTARIEYVAREATRQLRKERARVKALTLRAREWDAVAPGLEDIVRAARRAMRRAGDGGDAERLHTWRRRVKAHWLALRVIEGRCGRRLAAERRRVETLDGLLGDFNNGAILQDVLVAERIGSRRATAACLRVLRRRDAALRRDAMALGREVYLEPASQVTARIGEQWHAAQASRDAAVPRRRR
jgi:CHAD domain-containing protein